MELVDEERMWRHALPWGKEDQNESTKLKKRIQSRDIRRLTCFSEIQNLVMVVENKIGPGKAQHHQCWLLGGLGECSPKELLSSKAGLSPAA